MDIGYHIGYLKTWYDIVNRYQNRSIFEIMIILVYVLLNRYEFHSLITHLPSLNPTRIMFHWWSKSQYISSICQQLAFSININNISHINNIGLDIGYHIGYLKTRYDIVNRYQNPPIFEIVVLLPYVLLNRYGFCVTWIPRNENGFTYGSCRIQPE